VPLSQATVVTRGRRPQLSVVITPIAGKSKKGILGSRSAVRIARFVGVVYGLCLLFGPKLLGQSVEEFDSYKLRLEGFWAYSSPTGNFQGAADSGAVNLTTDLHFGSYSTFAGKVDWKFTHKNHLYVLAIPFNSDRAVVLDRTIVFNGKTFEAGLNVQANLRSPMYGFGYQWDVIRRRRGHVGLAAQFNVFDSHASINAAAQVTGSGMHQAALYASDSLVAPIPVAGPEFRYYLTNSPRVFVEGDVYGMYFFGYGNFVSSFGTLGVNLTRRLSVNAGYQLGSRLVVKDDISTNRLGLTLTQKGPLVGLEFSF
jgi:hypothetical protein